MTFNLPENAENGFFFHFSANLMTVKIFWWNGQLTKTRKMTTCQCVKMFSRISGASPSQLLNKTDLFGAEFYFSPSCSL